MTECSPSFEMIGNDLAVDFVNTQVMMHGELVDLIQTTDDLRGWFSVAGLPIDGALDEKGLKAALELRHAIAELFTSFREGEAASMNVLTIINKHLPALPAQQTLVFEQNIYHLIEACGLDTLQKALAKIACAAATLVVNTPGTALRKCASDTCVLIFKDDSRSQRRRWCSMKTCGNRAKVATHYRNTQDDR